MSATRGEYQGKQTLTLKDEKNDKVFLTFGAAKARLVIKELDAIKAFVAEAEAAWQAKQNKS